MSILLSQLATGKAARITLVEADASLKRRLLALGIQTLASVHIVRRAQFDGPLHVRLGHTDIILRSQDAARIQVQLT